MNKYFLGGLFFSNFIFILKDAPCECGACQSASSCTLYNFNLELAI